MLTEQWLDSQLALYIALQAHNMITVWNVVTTIEREVVLATMLCNIPFSLVNPLNQSPDLLEWLLALARLWML